MNTPRQIPEPARADWLSRVAAPIWQMLTGIGQLRATETVLILGGDARERAFAAEAASLLGAGEVVEQGPAQLALVLDGAADVGGLIETVSAGARIIVRSGDVEGRVNVARIAARGLTVRGFDVRAWSEANPEQLRDIVAALDSCRGGPSSPLLTLSYRAIGDAV